MRVLVTGGAGFIGSSIARALVARGDDVRVLDDLSSGSPGNVPEGADLVKGDIGDGEAMRAACLGREIVFHQAAVRSVPRSVAEPQLVNRVNVEGTLNVLVGAEQAGVGRVIFASSSSVYGETGAEVQQEDHPSDPCSPYAVSKLAGEGYCRVWAQLKALSTVSLRYFNVFGPGQHPDSQYAAVFPAFVEALRSGRSPEVHWDGEQTRDFTYVDDVVRANLLAAEAGDHVSGRVYNVAGGKPRSVNEVLSAVSDAAGVWIEPERRPRRAGDIRHTHADISAAERDLGWRPQANWDDAVKATVAWFEEAGL